MKERPAIGETVKVIGSCLRILTVTVTRHGDHPSTFFVMVEKVSGMNKEPGSYPVELPYHVDNLVE